MSEGTDRYTPGPDSHELYVDAMEAKAKIELAEECEHDWKQEYYGTRCQKCDTFYAFGSEPWAPTDDALAELQSMETRGDDLLDAGIEPLTDKPVESATLRCVCFGCDYAPLIYLRVGETKQTRNGYLVSKIDGWYCPMCAGGYGGMTSPTYCIKSWSGMYLKSFEAGRVEWTANRAEAFTVYEDVADALAQKFSADKERYE